MRIAFDTNVLLRIANPHDPLHQTASSAYLLLSQAGHAGCFTLQNITEFWRVATRPKANNGFGLDIADVDLQVRDIERWLEVLPESPDVYAAWRNLAVQHRVRGKEVHDGRLAATLYVCGVTHLLTWDGGDFKRFDSLTCVTPEQVLKGALA